MAAAAPPALAVLLFLLAAASRGASAEDWTYGRATKYGNDGGSTVHEGSCMFGYLDPNKGTGWDIAALSDTDPSYSGSCGRCYEVACVDDDIKDGYGSHVGRKGACFDTSKTVTITITDTCPCYYPKNAYSNKRWCCGDKPHMDLSYTAFDKLAHSDLGVIALRWRRVACPDGAPTKPRCNNWASCFGTEDNHKGPAPSSSSSSSSSDGSNGNNNGGSNNNGGNNNGGGGFWGWDEKARASKWIDAFSNGNSNSGGSNSGSSGSNINGGGGSGGGFWGWDDKSRSSKWISGGGSNSGGGGDSNKGGGFWGWDDKSRSSKWIDGGWSGFGRNLRTVRAAAVHAFSATHLDL